MEQQIDFVAAAQRHGATVRENEVRMSVDDFIRFAQTTFRAGQCSERAEANEIRNRFDAESA